MSPLSPMLMHYPNAPQPFATGKTVVEHFGKQVDIKFFLWQGCILFKTPEQLWYTGYKEIDEASALWQLQHNPVHKCYTAVVAI